MRRMLALGTALLTLLSGCAEQQTEAAEGTRYSLWFAATEEVERDASTVVAEEVRTWPAEPAAMELLAALLRGPTEAGLASPFPAGVSVRSTALGEDGVLLVDLTEQYGDLTGVDLTVADSCIALTLCQLPSVEAVRVTVEGETIPYRNRQVLGTGDVLLSGVGGTPEDYFTVLYFPRRDGLGLTAEYRSVERRPGTGQAAVLVEELLQGPSIETGGQPLPEGIQVRRVTVEGGVCRLDLSAEFTANVPQSESQAVLTLYALVNTLCTLGGVERVQILVEGEAVPIYGGISLEAPLETNPELIVE